MADTTKRVMIFSGAGLSAESGLRTFRDSDGLWEEYNVMEVCSAKGFAKDRQKVLEFYDKRRIQLGKVTPNIAHKTIAALQAKYGEKIVIITQNVDDLLERAGCDNVLHLHGFLPEIYCESCKEIIYLGYKALQNTKCEKCGTYTMRHNIVMFGEYAPYYAQLDSELLALRNACGMLVCIGTSGEVINVAQFTQYASKSILNNIEETWFNEYFDICLTEPATTAAPKIYDIVANFIESV